MTQSGQEPPDSGRGIPDESGNSGASSELRTTGRRRRKRRSGSGAKGSPVTQNGVAAASFEGKGQNPTLAVSGSISTSHDNQARPSTDGEDSASTQKRRRKRRRGRAKSQTEQASGTHQQQHALNPHSSSQPQPGAEGVTSPKGKKAARRRGRKRWQARNNQGVEQQAVSGNRASNVTSQNVSGPTEESLKPQSRQRSEAKSDNWATSATDEFQKPKRPQGYRPKAPHGQNSSPLYAALDLGTNNCRLLIARPEERGFRVVDAYSRIVRLGEGVDSQKRLSDAAMDRAIEALANCHRKLSDRGVARSRLIATEACRAAENGSEFIDRVKTETGLALEVVNRETEARLAVAGCASLVDHEADGVILFDIGGGSSEIVWLDLRNRCGARGYALTRFIRSWISLPVGVVNLAERHGGVHVTPDIFEAMVEDAADHLAAFNLANNLTEAIASGRVHMLGTSGTVTTLAGVHLGLKRYDRRRVDGTWLDDSDVSRMIDELRDMPYEARMENPCIGADRADLVLAGCAILEAIRRRWTCPRLRVADRGLREGILTELMAADGVWARRRSRSRFDRGRQGNRA
ncbi:exopolyphosphatase [uncultured Roseibium sp.]|uniref:Ppx/GppA phosphatase family protein n=1 Tax=uncultured Roseibium sp. TaxID=1936171 RepID=UPI00261EEAD4|nr:exopolyphosphatase [uncultured Roseibium sp.]